MKRLFWVSTLVLVCCLGFVSLPALSAVIYVKADAPGVGDGSSWTNAFHSVQAAASVAQAAVDDPDNPVVGDQIWVAEGTYSGGISLKAGVQLYGGFSGSETAREQRNPVQYPTILDGGSTDIVITMQSGSDQTTIVDGFRIQNGHGDHGGGICCRVSSAQITDNVIVQNSADQGGGIYAVGSKLALAGNVIAKNISTSGAGIYAFNASGLITDSTIAQNTATGDGGGIYTGNSTLTIANDIIYQNSSGIFVSGGSVVSRCNCVFGNGSSNYSGIQSGCGDISIDPSLANPTGGDYHLVGNSPCIEAGDNSLVQGGDRRSRREPQTLRAEGRHRSG